MPKSIASRGPSYRSSFRANKNPEAPLNPMAGVPTTGPSQFDKGSPIRKVLPRFIHTSENPATMRAYPGSVNAAQLEDRQMLDTAQALRDSGRITSKQLIKSLRKYKESKKLRGVI